MEADNSAVPKSISLDFFTFQYFMVYVFGPMKIFIAKSYKTLPINHFTYDN